MTILIKRPDEERYWWWCPGCASDKGGWGLHIFDERWDFNGDMLFPTFRASYLAEGNWKGKPTRCHSFVTDGKIEYLSDSTHSLAGQTVQMVDIPEPWDAAE